jgi:hypothetical protein
MAGELGFVPEGPHIEEVSGIRKIYNEEHGENDVAKRHSGSRHHEKRHPKEYLHAIAKAAERSNEQLAQKSMPYRFCVYEEEGSVIIDLVLLNKEGAVVKEIKRNITDEDFDRMIENISSIEGLLFDRNG